MIELAQSEVDAFLRRQLVGRVGCHSDGSTYVVPVIYVWDGDCVYVQSMEGRKIEMMRRNPEVCFEVDEYAPDGSWCSVILRGVYEELGSARTEQLHLEFEELVEEIARQGKRFAKNPTQELLILYKSMVKDFLQYVTKHMLQVEHRAGGKLKQKLYSVTTVIDKKLEDLTAQVMSQQANNIQLLSTLDEIRGILIDLVK